jgi:hypothetical protein
MQDDESWFDDGLLPINIVTVESAQLDSLSSKLQDWHGSLTLSENSLPAESQKLIMLPPPTHPPHPDASPSTPTHSLPLYSRTHHHAGTSTSPLTAMEDWLAPGTRTKLCCRRSHEFGFETIDGGLVGNNAIADCACGASTGSTSDTKQHEAELY